VRFRTNALISVASILTLLLVWAGLTTLFDVPAVVLPSPSAMWAGLKTLLTAGYSLFRSLGGLVAGLLIAIPVGLLMGRATSSAPPWRRSSDSFAPSHRSRSSR
jgi:ABC-type nitrate/sulfonate/bicarbonate transport system permease component